MTEAEITENDVAFIVNDLQRSISAIAGTIQMLRKDRVRMKQRHVLKRLEHKYKVVKE